MKFFFFSIFDKFLKNVFFSILRPTNCVFGHILTFSTPKLCIWHTYDSPFQKRRTNEIHAFLVCFAYMTLGMSSYEKFFRKFFFQKVHFILNIFIYYGIFISLILLELSYIENSLQNSFFGLKSLENLTLRVSGKDSKWKYGVRAFKIRIERLRECPGCL